MPAVIGERRDNDNGVIHEVNGREEGERAVSSPNVVNGPSSIRLSENSSLRIVLLSATLNVDTMTRWGRM